MQLHFEFSSFPHARTLARNKKMQKNNKQFLQPLNQLVRFADSNTSLYRFVESIYVAPFSDRLACTMAGIGTSTGAKSRKCKRMTLSQHSLSSPHTRNTNCPKFLYKLRHGSSTARTALREILHWPE